MHHFSSFVSKRARAANNPVSSGVLYSENGKGKKDTSDRRPRPQNTMATSYAARGNSIRPSSFVPLGREIQNCQPTWRQRRSGNGKCLLCDAPHQLLMEL